jgi:hypothetical protein
MAARRGRGPEHGDRESWVIEVSKIRIDGGTQSRAAINEQTVAEYAEAMEDPRTVFPPVVAYYDGRDYWLADGFHRVEAWKRIGRVEVPAEVRQGDRRAAVLHSCAANAAHGLRRTNDDKRRAVMTLLEDAEWSQWSNREIARRCGVHYNFVGKLRADVTITPSDSEAPRTYTTKHGTEAQMDTSRIGKTDPAPEPAPVEPMLDTPVEPEAETAPEPEPRPDPYGYAKLTDEALLDTANGLRADLDDAKKRIRTQTSEIADLKTKLKDFTGDKDEAIRRLTKQIEHLNSEMFRANDAARVKTVAARRAQDEAKALRAQLESQVIHL